ncbi:sigma-70 family RNA polymerase sigma factor [Duganella radicis]|nr:sigma-70 family RNA polymerase sigma factor [Duganella radicis]
MGAGLNIDMDEAALLWAEFTHGRNASVRERLAALYMPFARMLAAKMYAGRTHHHVEFDDYLQYARVGLLEAVDRYDVSRGYKFETYAGSRINGAILSGMESYSEVHEQVAARKRIVEERMASLQDAPRPADKQEDLFGYLAELAIGLAVGFALDQTGMFEAAEPAVSHYDYTYAGVELRQLRARLKSLVNELPGKHRQVIHSHYLQQMPFDEIARALSISKGRVSQIHKEALLRLRDSVRAAPELNWSG